ncbi:MAG: ABC transporter permease [Candidatus Aminicenantes bacterium]|nr:ABC transporter permease [Candidatus Aminicenantes bacterium]
MLTNYLKVALRNIFKHKGYSFINIFGLAAGMASAVLILLFVRYERSYDRFHEKADRIHRVAVRAMIGDTKIRQTYTPAILTPTLLENYPEVERSVRFQSSFDGVTVRCGDEIFNEYRVGSADTDIFKVFTLPMPAGDPETALAEPNSVVITESTAKKYFENGGALNKTLTIDGTDFRVTGIIADWPDNSHFRFDMIRSLLTYKQRLDNPNWFANNYRTYILLREGTSAVALDAKFPDLVRNYAVAGQDYDAWLEQGNYWEYYLQPLTGIHLHSDLNGEFSANGNASYVSVSFLIALFILLIASVNYMNLATARSANRAREVGIRKAVGSTRGPLLRQFLAESLAASLMALLLALSLAHILLPAFRSLTGRAITMPYTEEPLFLPGLLGLAFVLGLFSGAYPALFLASVHPIRVLRGRFQSGSANSRLRNLLVLFQFAISIFLVIGTFIVHRQTTFMRSRNLGFDKENVVVIKTPEPMGERSQAFKDKLLTLAEVKVVSGSDTTPGRGFMNWGCKPEGREESITLNMVICDYGYLETMGLEMAEGRFFSREYSTDVSGLVLNEAAAKLLAWDNSIGKTIIYSPDATFTVIGVVKDYHYESLHYSVRPEALLLQPGIWGAEEDYISVRIHPGNIPQTLGRIRNVWKEFSNGVPLEYSFLDTDFDELYQNETRTGRIFTVFSALAIGIGCLGLLGLAAFAAEQKTREIGIRRVLGASVPGIMMLLSKDLSRWVALANLVAWPAAYFIMRSWLNSFAYRIGISWLFFIAAAVMTLLIAWFSMSFQAYRAANTDPVKALKYE